MTLFGEIRTPLAATVLATVLASSACVDIVGADFAKYIEREEKRFSTSEKPDVSVSTFDGAIEIRPWDRPEVLVVIEKRASSKEDAATLEIQSEQTGNRIVVNVVAPKMNGFGLHFHNRSAKLIVSLPKNADVSAKSSDGSIDVEGIAGRLTLRSGDGSIRGRALNGEVNAHTGDGSIRLDGVNGALTVDTGDGSIVAAGKFTSVRARSGDGSVRIAADPGSTSSADWNISTGDGSVTLALPEDFGAEIDAHTGDGGIHVQNLELTGVTGSLGKDTVRGRVGSGGGAVRVRTGDGSITLKRSLPAEATSSER